VKNGTGGIVRLLCSRLLNNRQFLLTDDKASFFCVELSGPQQASRETSMIVILKKTEAAEPFSFSFQDANGKTLLRSENYKVKSSALNGIESVKKNCIEMARYELKEAKNGKLFFNLKASNGQVVGTSAMFDSGAARDASIDALKKEAPGAVVEEQL
jgi:uncharacterized protein YegP (UPF0339 family)